MGKLATLLSGAIGRAGRTLGLGAEETPAYDGPLVAMKSRPDRVGDSYRFAWEHEVTRSSGGHSIGHWISEEFRIDIRSVRPDGLTLVRTRIASDLGGTDRTVQQGPYFSHAWKGVPVLFDAEPCGEPRNILNWREATDTVLANMKRDAPDELYKDAKAYLGGARPEVFARRDIGSELLLLSGVQFRGEVPERMDYTPEPMRGGVLHRSIQVSRLDDDRFRVEKLTRHEPGRRGQPIWNGRTASVVAADDGWVIELETVITETRPDLGGEEVTTTRVRRLAGPETA